MTVLSLRPTPPLIGWLGYAFGALNGQSVETLLPVASRIFYQTHFFPLLKIAGEVEEVYLALRTAQGSELPVLVNAVRREHNGLPVNDCIFMVVRQRSRYEDRSFRPGEQRKKRACGSRRRCRALATQ